MAFAVDVSPSYASAKTHLSRITPFSSYPRTLAPPAPARQVLLRRPPGFRVVCSVAPRYICIHKNSFTFFSLNDVLFVLLPLLYICFYACCHRVFLDSQVKSPPTPASSETVAKPECYGVFCLTYDLQEVWHFFVACFNVVFSLGIWSLWIAALLIVVA